MKPETQFKKLFQYEFNLLFNDLTYLVMNPKDLTDQLLKTRNIAIHEPILNVKHKIEIHKIEITLQSEAIIGGLALKILSEQHI